MINSFQPHTVQMDLGLYYEWHSEVPLPGPFLTNRSGFEIPRCIIDEFVQKTQVSDMRRPPPEGWSNEWEHFKYLSQWLAPCLYWGDSDSMNLRVPISSFLRENYHIFGYPIPLLYNKHSSHVIFRVGSRSFFVAFEIAEDGIIKALGRISLSPEHILSEEISSNILYSDLAQEILPCSDYGCTQLKYHQSAVSGVLKFSVKAGLIDESDFQNYWSQEKWRYLHSMRKDYIRCTKDCLGKYGDKFVNWLKERKLGSYGEGGELAIENLK